MKIKEIKDFKDTPYYEWYCKMVDNYSMKIIKTIMQTQGNNEVKYTWNDVLKEVWKFINTEVRELKDSDDINPSREEMEKEEVRKLLDDQAKSYLGMN